MLNHTRNAAILENRVTAPSRMYSPCNDRYK